MTIHTQWMQILRENASEAFSHELASPVHASFIDGQIKLMKSDAVTQWHAFLHSQFVSVIMRHFQTYGASTVILAFDDKQNVPFAKSITQLKRRQGIQIIDFDENDVLPNELPSPWIEAIQNPFFKNKVIEYICINVPRLVYPPHNSRLIVDWKNNTAVQYLYDETGVSESLIDKEPIGEADLKFPMWMKRLQTSFLIEATDGDYIPIALSLRLHAITHPVVILKGKRDDLFEFITIHTLLSRLVELFKPLHLFSNSSASSNLSENDIQWAVRIFIVFLGLSGTDFSRAVALISPARMFQFRYKLAAAIMDLFSTVVSGTDSSQLQTGRQAQRFFKILYACVFPKHFNATSSCSLESQASRSSLGVRNKVCGFCDFFKVRL